VASYNPWVSLYWLVSGRTIGGWTMYPRQNRLDRTTALRLWTEANTWFSNEEGKKGMIKVGQLADLAVLSADYMTVAEEEIKGLTSVITLLGGDIVHAGGPFRDLSPPLPAASPDWSPVNRFGGYYDRETGTGEGHTGATHTAAAAHTMCMVHGRPPRHAGLSLACGCWMG
jgi:hypothetical protein